METKIKRIESKIKALESYLYDATILNENEIIETMITELKDSIKALRVDKIKLKDGFVYNPESKILTKHDKKIPLTKTELNIFDYLVSQKSIVSFDDIKVKVWGDKVMSRHALRNMIKAIRSKTYDDIILSHSNIGYEYIGGVK